MNVCTFTCLVLITCSLPSYAQEAVVIIPPRSLNTSLNSVAEFNCTAIATLFAWRRNGVQIFVGNGISISSKDIAQNVRMSTLRVTVSSTTASSITCEALKQPPLSKNESDPALLLVQGLLESVSNLAVTPVNSTTVLISWSPPFTLEGVPILGYNVTITNTSSGENETLSVEGDTNMLYYSIDHIKSTFTITVVPINVVGAGDKASMPYSTITTSSTSQAVVLSVSTARTPTPLPRAGDNLAGIVGGTAAAAAVIFAALIVPLVVCIIVYCVPKCRNTNTDHARKKQTPSKDKLLKKSDAANWSRDKDVDIPSPSNLDLDDTSTELDKTIPSLPGADVPDLSDCNHEEQGAVARESSETVLAKFKSDNLIIGCDDIEIGKKIGNGTFGDVHEARLVSNKQQVAVKTCKSSHSDAVKCQFLYEADILRHYEHSNIVKLIGVVLLDDLCIVMENVGWTFKYFLSQADRRITNSEQLTVMCAQVCTGMEYLESSKCVHRRVTARNCLVDRNNSVKISNFGTSYGKVQLDSSNSKLRPVPVKWIAPEALKYGTYSCASDVWSFGVLLWETFSFGQEPYPGITDNKVREKVKKGYRMNPPTNCPPPVYDVMRKCWEYESRKRPTFAELLIEMRKLT